MKKRLFPAMLAFMLLIFACAAPGSCAEAPALFAPQGEWQVFCFNGLYGIQTLDGEIVVPAEYIGIEPVRGDLCVVETVGTNVYHPLRGLWRLSTREMLQPCVWDVITVTDTVVILDDGHSLMQLYDPCDDRVLLSSDSAIIALDGGRSFVYSTSSVGEDGTLHDCVRLVHPDGTVFLEVQDACLANDAPDGSDYLRVYVDIDPETGVFETAFYSIITGERLSVPDPLRCISGPVDGYAPAYISPGQYCIIDCAGNRVSPAYQEILVGYYGPEYGNGLFSVRQEDGWYIIRVASDSDPDVLFGPVRCSGMPVFYEQTQMFSLPTEEGTVFYSAALCQDLFLEGTTVVCTMRSGLVICRDGRDGFLFEDMTVIEPSFTGYLPFLGIYGFVRIDDLWHPIDRSGNVDMDTAYAYVNLSNDGLYYYAWYENGETCCLDPALQPITHLSIMAVG